MTDKEDLVVVNEQPENQKGKKRNQGEVSLETLNKCAVQVTLRTTPG